MGCATSCRKSCPVATWEPPAGRGLDLPTTFTRIKGAHSTPGFVRSKELSHYPDVIAYAVDSFGTILDVLTPDSWATAAAEAGCELPLKQFLGHCIFDFMSAFLRDFYVEVIANLLKAPVGSCSSFRWFCDSPAERKEMVLYMEKTAPTAVAILSITVKVQAHRASFLTFLKAGEEACKKNCSICNRFSHRGIWLTPEAYYLALAQEGDLSVVNVSHCICPECSAMVTRIAPRFAEDHGGELCHVTPDSQQGCVPPNSCRLPQFLHLLIVDDDLVTAKVVQALARAMGHTPYVITDPTLVPNFLQGTKVDAVLMDVVMPEVMGFDLVRQLRGLQFREPIVCMSGSSEYANDCLAAGAQKFLAKPVTSDTLRQVLAVLRTEPVGWESL